jgi:alkyl hydroperoxide reductase subunit AhpF
VSAAGRRVAVIGGGLAGIAAALDCAVLNGHTAARVALAALELAPTEVAGEARAK